MVLTRSLDLIDVIRLICIFSPLLYLIYETVKQKLLNLTGTYTVGRSLILLNIETNIETNIEMICDEDDLSGIIEKYTTGIKTCKIKLKKFFI